MEINLNEVQRNLVLLSLSNLIEEYSNALEDNQLSAEGRSFMIQAIQESIKLRNQLDIKPQTHKISRPSW